MIVFEGDMYQASHTTQRGQKIMALVANMLTC